ncbi:hypothetical protein LNTAR_10176 [Lentisphaera araneosa HTCC2155]|uniref:Uncharacterized protein n=1 Tax=Lentisphaera araneosa HTCC2155 TaxID=313628 RepID=A6DII8_9BACT|nr:hypothetical protein [Lentisphaera araneosa]EDM28274.1 hypothetical protein LNTAR_10176 [Lentisphaera araneosa HTCC2155]
MRHITYKELEDLASGKFLWNKFFLKKHIKRCKQCSAALAETEANIDLQKQINFLKK